MKFPWMVTGLLHVALISASLPCTLAAQSRHDPLTPAEAEAVREVTDLPVERMKLYMRYVNERSSRIAELGKDQLVQHRGEKMHQAIDEYISLIDEVQDNLDEYQGYETNKVRPVPDLRKLLPEMQKSIAIWQQTVTKLPPNADYDFVRESSTEALDSLKDQAAELVASQKAYFEKKKAEEKQRQKDEDKPYVIP
jgi:hypothetical protein